MARVERLDPDDWRRLRDVRLRALVDAPDAFGSSLERERGHHEGEWRRLGALGPWWVAVDDGGDVGIVSAGASDDAATVRVYAMWVDPRARGQGVADALLDAVRDHAASLGARTLSLDVTDRALRARRFYERYGFAATGATEPLHRDPQIELVELALPLTGPTEGR